MPKSKALPIGPFPLGQDSYHEEKTDDVFQPSEARHARLMVAKNVDINDHGWWETREGIQDKLGGAPISDVIGGFVGAGMVLIQHGDSIGLVDTSADPWTISDVVTGLDEDAVVAYVEMATQVWWTNGIECGRIDSADDTAKNWGMDAAIAPTVSAGSGDFPAGRYHVAVTFTDTHNVEHASEDSALITLASAGGITVSMASIPDDAALANIYVSETNQDGMVYSKTIAVGAFPTTLSSYASDAQSDSRPLRTLGMRGPIPSDGLFSFMGFILSFRDEVLFRTNGISHHVFFIDEHITTFPGSIVSGGGLVGGFWVVTTSGAWWMQADGDPANWRPLRADYRKYLPSAPCVVEGSELPFLQSPGLIALFVSEEGLMAGLPGGQMRAITDQRLSIDTSNDPVATICLSQSRGVKQVLFSVEDTTP